MEIKGSDCMKIVFGGAFNPVTNAHMKVYQFLTKKYPNASFIFLPVSSAYTKSDLASNYHRVNMLELAVKDLPKATISNLEINDSDFKGTYQSLIRLSDKYEEEIYFVVGADNLESIDKWINAPGIVSEFKIIVLGRDNIDVDKIISEKPLLQEFSENIIRFDDFNVEISSTQFRDNFNQELVPKSVYEYVIDNGLYRGENDVS
jgi:nicotinate-nucleotide adenylyltransferase